MAIHTRRHTYDPAEALTPWVYAIARYKLIDHLRHTRASMKDVPIEDAEELMAQDDHVGTESANDMTRLLSGLPEKMRRAIQAVKLDGLSIVEAASVSGMSESSVKVNVHRGMKAWLPRSPGRGTSEDRRSDLHAQQQCRVGRSSAGRTQHR